MNAIILKKKYVSYCNLDFYVTNIVYFKVHGTSRTFSAMFSKGINFRGFLFAYLEDEVFLVWGLLFQERICSDRSKFFPL